MAIEDIFKALEEQAEAECGQILRSAREQADAIVGEARDEADRMKQARVELAAAAARHRGAQTLNSARLENRKEMAAVRDRAVERAFDEAERRLAGMRSDARYAATFEGLATQALDAIESYGACTLHVAPADAALAEKVAAGRGCAVEATQDYAGGAAVSAKDGRIVVRNTFEDRLAKVRRNAQSHVAEMLFE